MAKKKLENDARKERLNMRKMEVEERKKKTEALHI